MSLVAKDAESSFVPVPPGMHLARCYRVVDLGTQTMEFAGEKKQLYKVMLVFEVHGEDENGQPLVTQKGEPMTISKNFTKTLAEKSTLRKDLQSWRGREFTAEELRGFHLKKVLGTWAMIQVIKTVGANGKEYTNISSIAQVPHKIKTAGLPEGYNEPALFTIDEPDLRLYETFSSNLRARIESSPEWKAMRERQPTQKSTGGGGAGLGDLESDIPF